MKAFLGTGLLGSNFVKALLKRGEEVKVWNRTAGKAQALEAFGAKAFDNPADAVRDVHEIHLTLKDDASVDEVLEAASAGFPPNVLIMDHTTTSKAGAIKRTSYWAERGYIYCHAPVFMGPQNALEGTGFMLLSGEEKLYERLKPHLPKMTGKLLYFGTEVGRAAAMKLIGNAFLVSVTAGLRDALALAKSMDVPVSDMNTLFGEWNPGAHVLARLKRMTSTDQSAPSWELAMARKDTGLFLEAAGDELVIMQSIAALMDEWISKGFGNHDWTVIGSPYADKS